MKSLRMTMLALTLASLTLSVGCGGGGGAGDGPSPAEEKIRSNQLTKLGIAYHSYFETFGKGPAKPEDLAQYLENDEKVLGPLKSGEIVFIYNVGLRDMPNGTSETVLAYEKIVPEKGGLVLMGDAKPKKMTADEFKKATLAKPKDK